MVPQSNLIKAWLNGSTIELDQGLIEWLHNRTWSRLDWMARMQFYHKNSLKLRNGKIDAPISKGSVSIRDLNFIHSPIWFLHNILWVFIVSRQKMFVAGIQSQSPLISTKDEVNFDHLTITKWKRKKKIIKSSNKRWYVWVAKETNLKSIGLHSCRFKPCCWYFKVFQLQPCKYSVVLRQSYQLLILEMMVKPSQSNFVDEEWMFVESSLP